VPYYQNHQFTPKPLAMSDIINENSEIGQQNNNSVVNNNITHIYGDKKIKKHLGTIPTFPERFLGRKNEAEAIHQSLTTKQNLLLLVNGEGGIGKTTLASKYYYQYRNYYQHLVWVFSGISIIEALLSLKLPLGVDFPDQATNEQRLTILLRAMAELNEPCLLIIDNANEINDIEKYHGALLQCANFHVLLTTRVNKKLHNTELYEVKPLDKIDALALFKAHYAEHDAAEDTLFFTLFEKVNRNTLVVELLAKNLSNFNDGLEIDYTLDHLLQDLNDSLLKLSKSETVGTFYQSQNGILRTETPENIIAAMYDLGKLDETEKRLLSIFAVLPAESIPYAILKDLAEQERLNKFLIGLFEKGWLDYDKTNNSFRISPVVQEVVKSKNDNLYRDCEDLIRRLIDKLLYQPGLGHLVNSTYEEAAILVRYAESIVLNLNDLENSLSILCERIGNYYNVTGNLEKTFSYFEKASKIDKNQLSNNPNNPNFKNGLAIAYSKLGSTHSDLGNLKLALDFFEKDIQLTKELYESYPNNVSFKNNLAISYSKLGETHSALGNLKLALDFFEKDIQLTKELYESYPNNVSFKNGLAIAYSKLGTTHSALGNLKLALDFFEIETTLFEELYESYPNNVSFKNNLAISCEKLGSTHSALGNLKLALDFFEIETTLFEELYESYPNNVSFKNGLAIAYGQLGTTHSALGNLKLALDFFEKFTDLMKELYESYPNNVSFKNGLAIAYSKLGSTHSALGNLKLALDFFEKFTDLMKELYESYPNNVSFKNGLAIAYGQLGTTHSALGNLKLALDFFEIETTLFEELYESYPNNVSFKNGLAISYAKLGQQYQAANNRLKAFDYFKNAEKLWEELVIQSPQYVQFQQFLGIVRNILKDLG
jgi:Flp pilus assembly protein TadD